jgi:hypothetical protein
MVALWQLLLYFVILGLIAYLVETYLPMAQPFKIVVRVVIVVIAIYLLLDLAGVAPLALRR